MLLVLVIVNRPEGPAWAPAEGFDLVWQVAPDWPGTTRSPPAAPPSRLAIYLDVSAPMGGFLPPTPGAESPLATLLPQLGAHAARVPGLPNLDVEWRAFPNEPELLASAPQPIGRELFRGGESPLGGRVREILERLEKREIVGAVLVTDLVATGELTGAMGVATALTTAAQGAPAQQGNLHVGLFGVRSPYWGVRTPSCQGAQGLGCWYSEYRQGFFPLNAVSPKPLYFLVLGLRREVVETLGEGLANLSKERRWPVLWELLSAASSSKQEVTTACTVVTPEGAYQRTLLVTQERNFQCLDDEKVEVRCSLAKLAADLPFTPRSASSTWAAVSTKVSAEEFRAVIDCEALRKTAPTEELLFRLQGPAKPTGQSWGEWSTETDDRLEDLDRTLHLSHFVERVRLVPGGYVMGTKSRVMRR